ncbi:MAG: fumarylacetoacetate hydrolase family protein [Dehalococcoidia bacterium]|nr:fumarylacetoacetate hydrolase family protein [Dehalococcoidia bacterium]
MRIARVRHERRTSTAIIEGDVVHLVSGGPFGSLTRTGVTVPLSDVQLLVPVQPSKIVAMAVNYHSHAGDRSVSPKPEAFLKAPSSLIGPGEAIVIPAGAENVHAEAEVVVVIGRRARGVRAAEADRYIFGYTAGNDVSARDWQRLDTQWWRAKSADTFTAVGPWIETDLTPDRIPVEGRISGRRIQRGDTSQLVHSIRACIEAVSAVMTLERGDLLFTGTPETTAAMAPGDVAEVEVEGIGILRNPVVAG